MNYNAQINDGKVRQIVEKIIIEESVFTAKSFNELKNSLKNAILKGLIISTTTISIIAGYYHLTSEEANELKDIVNTEQNMLKPQWDDISE